MRDHIAFVIPPEGTLTPNAGRELDLHASGSRQVDRIVVVESAETNRDLREIGDDPVAGQPVLDVAADVMCELTIPSPEKQRGEHSATTKAVDGHDDVHMFDEVGEVGGVGWRESSGGEVLRVIVGVENAVIGGAGSLSRVAGDPIGRHLEPPTVEGHEAERRAQLDFLDGAALGEQ